MVVIEQEPIPSCLGKWGNTKVHPQWVFYIHAQGNEAGLVIEPLVNSLIVWIKAMDDLAIPTCVVCGLEFTHDFGICARSSPM